MFIYTLLYFSTGGREDNFLFSYYLTSISIILLIQHKISFGLIFYVFIFFHVKTWFLHTWDHFQHINQPLKTTKVTIMGVKLWIPTSHLTDRKQCIFCLDKVKFRCNSTGELRGEAQHLEACGYSSSNLKLQRMVPLPPNSPALTSLQVQSSEVKDWVIKLWGFCTIPLP